MKVLSIALIATIALAISGCSKVPECSGADSLTVLGRLEFALSAVGTSSRGEGVKKSICEAVLIGKDRGSDGKVEALINYSIQVADDGEDIYAKIIGGDLNEVVEGALNLVIAEAKKEKERVAVVVADSVDSESYASLRAFSANGKAASVSVVKRAVPSATGQIIASFDCSKASSSAERLVCADPELARLDLRLADIYKKLLKIYPDKAQLKGEQANWIRESRNACSSIDCMKSIYQERLSDLESAGQYLSKPKEFQ